ncbi:hypothetical protein EV1_000176 [Malus domestica]
MSLFLRRSSSSAQSHLIYSRPHPATPLSDVHLRCRFTAEICSFYEDEDKRDNVHVSFGADLEEVDRVCKVIDKLFTLDRNMEVVLDECCIHLHHDLVVEVLKSFQHARKPAFRFFCWAGQKPGFSHDFRTYNSMISILGKTRQFKTIMERKKAIGIFELMKYYKFKVGVDTINCLLDTHGRAKLKERFTPNLQTFTALLNGWCSSKNLMEVGRVWNEMVDKGFKHDIVAHNTMLRGLLRGHKRKKVALLMGYNVLIKVMTRQQRMPDDVVRIYKKMIQNGIKPSIHIYNMIMKSYFQTRNYHIGRAVWDEMIQKGFCPDDNSYTELAQKMKFAGKFEVSNVFARWAEMMRKRVKRRDPIENG